MSLSERKAFEKLQLTDEKLLNECAFHGHVKMAKRAIAQEKSKVELQSIRKEIANDSSGKLK